MEVQVPEGPVQQALPGGGGDGEAPVTHRQQAVPAVIEVQHQAVPDGAAAHQLRREQVVDQQGACKGPLPGLQAHRRRVAAVLGDDGVAEVAVVGVELKDLPARAVVDGEGRLEAPLLLCHGKVITSVEPGGVVAEAVFRRHGPPQAVPVQKIEHAAPHVAHRRLPGPHGDLGAGHAHRLLADRRAVGLEQAQDVGADHQQVVPQPGEAVVRVRGVDEGVPGAGGLPVHQPPAQGGEVDAVLPHGGQRRRAQHHARHQRQSQQAPEQAGLLLRLFRRRPGGAVSAVFSH